MRIVTAASLFDGHDAAINIMRRILQAQGCEVIHLGHNRSVDEVRHRGRAGGRAGRRRLLLPGRPQRVLPLPRRPPPRAEGRGPRQGLRRRWRRDHRRARSPSCRRTASRRSSRPRTGSAWVWRTMINTIVADVRRRPRRGARHRPRRRCSPATRVRWPVPITALEARPARRRAASSSSAPPRPPRRAARAGHHRHRRLGQVVAHRRAGAALPPRPGGQAPHRGARRRPHPPPRRRRAARRPHPHERHRPAAGPVPLAGHPRRRRAARGPRRHRRRLQGRRLRPRDRRDAGHRPGRRRDRRARRPPGLRHDPGVRRRQPAREDRHARLRRGGRHQQVRAPRRRGRAARRAPPDGPQPGALRRRPCATSRCSARSPPASTTTASPRSTSTSAAARRARPADQRGHAAPVAGRTSSKVAAIVPPRPGAVPRRDRRGRAGPPRPHGGAGRPRCARLQQLEGARDLLAERGVPTTDLDAALADDVEAELDDDTRALLDGVARDGRRPSPATPTRAAPPCGGSRCRARRCPAWPSPATTTRASCSASCARRTCPGRFPFTAGVFPFKRDGEDPARMFAGEGDAFRTNRRFHLLAEGQPATRLSTAFDSVTLYGFDPDERPDIFGKVGNAGVSIATLDDMEVLYAGFDLCDPSTSVSMTINGPAPTILAMFLNTAIDQQLALFAEREGRAPTAEEAETVRATTLRKVRGTVQADILKEDQGQNTCILSTEFALGLMADVQEWFVEHEVRQLLLRVDQRLPHRRSGREPPHPARLHARQRLHLRGGLPGRRAWPSTTSPPTCRSSSPTGWTRSTPCSVGWPGASGPSRCATATAPTSAARS